MGSLRWRIPWVKSRPVTSAEIRLLPSVLQANGRQIRGSERMKMRHPHVVPLGTQAIEIMKEVREITRAKSVDDYLFPNVRDSSRPMAATTINAVLIRAGFNHERLFRTHGAPGYIQHVGVRTGVHSIGSRTSTRPCREEPGESSV
ncbi:tyrosine-type recombinase/integrase [Paraburkholderia youngii]|uniref:tyrosine-type recombinase/integrase n=1 Tax=Paraburkholderia youngii TaxID=2782701 RepID=UPI003D1D4FB8